MQTEEPAQSTAHIVVINKYIIYIYICKLPTPEPPSMIVLPLPTLWCAVLDRTLKRGRGGALAVPMLKDHRGMGERRLPIAGMYILGIHTYIYIYMYTYTCVYTNIFIHMYKCIRIYIYIYVCTCTYVSMDCLHWVESIYQSKCAGVR